MIPIRGSLKKHDDGGLVFSSAKHASTTLPSSDSYRDWFSHRETWAMIVLAWKWGDRPPQIGHLLWTPTIITVDKFADKSDPFFLKFGKSGVTSQTAFSIVLMLLVTAILVGNDEPRSPDAAYRRNENIAVSSIFLFIPSQYWKYDLLFSHTVLKCINGKGTYSSKINRLLWAFGQAEALFGLTYAST